jgi:cutinase
VEAARDRPRRCVEEGGSVFRPHPRISTAPKRHRLTAVVTACAVAGFAILGTASAAQAADTGRPAPATATSAASCPDVDVVFARGTGEVPGLGIVGTPFAAAVAAHLPGKTVDDYAVAYAADFAQLSAGPGATDMSNHVMAVAAQCPGTLFVIGGYSQGASVTDIAVGIPTILGSGTTIPAALAPRVAAVVTFGNPIHLTGVSIPAASPTYAPKWDDFCAPGDPVCAGGVNVLSHLTYVINGDAASGAAYAAAKVLARG